MPEILVVSPLDADARRALDGLGRVRFEPRCRQEELLGRDDLAGADVIVLRSNVRLDAAVLVRHPRLRLVVRAGSGIDNIDADALARGAVRLARVGGAAAGQSVAEYAVWALLTLLRRFSVATRALLEGRWEKEQPRARELSGRSVAVWGYGPVGRATAASLASLGCHVRLLRRPSGRPAPFPQHDASELAAWADAHVLALPLDGGTRGLVGGAVLGWMSERSPIVVNAGRCETLDIDAALLALDDGVISGLAIDPIEMHERARFRAALADPRRNLVLTPHLGAQTEDAQRRVGARVVRAVTEVLGATSPSCESTAGTTA